MSNPLGGVASDDKGTGRMGWLVWSRKGPGVKVTKLLRGQMGNGSSMCAMRWEETVCRVFLRWRGQADGRQYQRGGTGVISPVAEPQRQRVILN